MFLVAVRCTTYVDRRASLQCPEYCHQNRYRYQLVGLYMRNRLLTRHQSA
jgi:hypothetical protein